MTAISFNNAHASSVYSVSPGHVVRTRGTWEAAWTANPRLHCVQCIWQAAPGLSAAVLEYHYGRVLDVGASSANNLTRLSPVGAFALVEWTTDEGLISHWLGYVDSVIDAADGPSDGTVPASGVQRLQCYGLERALQLTPIFDAVWKVDATTTARGGSGVTFNAGGRRNRTATAVNGHHVFDEDPDTAEFWSSRDIINYLLTWHLPTGTGGVATIPWTLATPSMVPDWDRPEVSTEGQTVYDIISRVLDARSLLGWGVGFDNTTLYVTPFSIAQTSVSLSGQTFPANTTQHSIAYDLDPLTTAGISQDSLDVVDQVIVRGSRRVSVCTLSYELDELVETWDTTDSTAYDDGASASTGYADLHQYDQRRRNQAAREQPALADVYRRLQIPTYWGFTANSQNVFLAADEASQYKPFLGNIRILDTLPLVTGVDYEGDPTAVSPPVGPGLGKELPPFVTLELPWDATKRLPVSRIAGDPDLLAVEDGEAIDWAVEVSAAPETRSILLEVLGAPQHALAGDDFVPLPVDTGAYGNFDYATCKATVAIEEDRYAEAIVPASAPSTDVVRRRVIHVGDAYKATYIAAGTVVRIDDTGAEVTSTGGYLRDDRARLGYLANLFAAYHTTPRGSIALTTRRRTGFVSVGHMITTVSGHPTALNAVVTRIQIDAPLGTDRRVPAPTQTIVASSARVDLLSTLQYATGGR